MSLVLPPFLSPCSRPLVPPRSGSPPTYRYIYVNVWVCVRARVCIFVFISLLFRSFNGELRVVRRRRFGLLLRLSTVTQGHRWFNRLYEHAWIKVAIIVVLRPKSCDVCDALGGRDSKVALTWYSVSLDVVHQVNAIAPIIVSSTGCSKNVDRSVSFLTKYFLSLSVCYLIYDIN